MGLAGKGKGRAEEVVVLLVVERVEEGGGMGF